MNPPINQLAPNAFVRRTAVLPFYRQASVPIWLARGKIVAAAFLIWTAIGVFQAFPDVLFRGFQWQYLAEKLIGAWVWVLLTPAILFINARLNASQQNVIGLAARHVLLSVPFSLAQTYLAALLEYPIPEIWWSPLRNTEFVMYYFLGGWMTYCAVVGVLQTFNYYKRFLNSQVELERVEKRLVETRLDALRLQLEPHFLFNTLNAISSETTENPKIARQMIEDLGALLRRSLECQDSNEITLAEELSLLDRYLAIQKLRFGDRIDIKIDVEPECLAAQVPSMLLQPVVENAIRHGIEGRLSGGTVMIKAVIRDDQLHLCVIDDGVGLPSRWRMDACAGLGIRVTRERLEALYSSKGAYSFTVARRRGGGTKAAIHIPLEVSPGGTGAIAA
jgi:two-component system, LytTR family, sensor kinase